MTRVVWPVLALFTLWGCGTSGPNATETPEHAVVAMLEVPTTNSPGSTPDVDPSADRGARGEPAVGPAAPLQKLSSCGLRAELSPGQHGMSTLTITNGGTKTVRLVVPGDGSEAGWRTPVLTWVAKRNGKPAKEREGGLCGMMNPIDPSEVFELAPGQSRSIAEWVGGPNVEPGTYEVELHYKNDPTLATRKGAGTGVEALLAATDACEVVTKSVHMTL